MFLMSFFGVSICLDLPPPCLFLISSNIFSFGLTVYTAFVDGALRTFIPLNLYHEKKHQQNADALGLLIDLSNWSFEPT